MRAVLSVTSECVPLIKTGGLADVAGALPAGLAQTGWQMRTLMPAYPGLIAKADATTQLMRFKDLMGGPARVMAGQAGGVDVGVQVREVGRSELLDVFVEVGCHP